MAISEKERQQALAKRWNKVLVANKLSMRRGRSRKLVYMEDVGRTDPQPKKE